MLVVTGASGLLGASLLFRAMEVGRDVTGICCQHPLIGTGATLVNLDLTDRDATQRALVRLSPSSVIHCAAATNVDWCEDHPEEAQRINVEASAFLAGLAAELGAEFMYVSTDAVFDGKQGRYRESDSPDPVNTYARTKLQGEEQVLRSNPSSLIARVNMYGWNAQNKQSLAEWVLGRLQEGKDVPGFTDVFFNPILVEDLSDVLLAMLDRRLTGLYHVVGGERVSKYHFAGQVAEMFGFPAQRVRAASVEDGTLRAARPRDTSLNTTKIRSELGRDMPDVASGLRKFKELSDRGYPARLKSYLSGVTQ